MGKEKDELKVRAGEVYRLLHKRYPDARCTLNFTDAYQLLVATILAAQCTDARVNIVTRGLFKKYPNPASLAGAEQQELEQDIRSTGFFRNKAKSLRAAAKIIVEKHGNKVPDTMEELLELPGVARKTANVILGNFYGVSKGITVDTHVMRVSKRLGLTGHSDPVKIEKDLVELFPKKNWAMVSHLLIFHGRACCTARKPNCADCPVNKLCPSAFTF